MKTFTRLLQSLVCALISILVVYSSAQAQTGSLTGTVRNCITNQTIPGVSIVCVVGPVLTNASGQFILNGIPAGTQTLTAMCVGYTTFTAPVVIIANQTTVYNFCMFPPPGILTGVITDCPNGNPILGAKVTWGTYSTYSTTGGLYSLSIYSGGTNALQVTKSGYNLYNQNGVTVTPPNTTTVNVQLNPGFSAPPSVTAALNGSQTAADISWTQPISSVELAYDDYVAEQCLIYANAGCISAVKFTPCGYPAILKQFKLSLCGPNPFYPLEVNVYNADGPGGMPGTLLEGPVYVTPPNFGWSLFAFLSPLTITSGSFYIGMVQLTNQNSQGLSVDTTTNQLRSYQKIGSGPWVIGSGNYMIHAIMDEPCGLVPPGNITYTVSRLLQGQENTPAAWVQVGMVTGSYTMTDNSWPSLPCGPYRWAVKPSFPCSGNTSPGFSNVIGKCWTATVTFHGQKCCAAMGKDGLLILAQNLDLPDTVYSVTTDTSGTAVIQNIWKGNYSITCSVFGCTTYIMTPVSIMGDMTMNINLNSGPVIPPSGLYVVDTTLLGKWYKPIWAGGDLLDEKWTSGSFTTNGWIISGGTNWQIAMGTGNPAPSAMFNWTPQVTNYDQYLTSKTITGTNSTLLQLLYDIQLSDYGTTLINTMAVEIWDGSTWNVLKTYDNSGGNIPWRSEITDISTYTAQTFKIRFHASGVDSWDINNWNIDNIRINTLHDMPCLMGYNFYLNNILDGFTSDTFYQIPHDHVIFGHYYVACVKAIYSYNPGYSSQNCFAFTAQYLYPVFNFSADSIDCSTYLTWQKPHMQNGTTPPGLIGYNIFKGDAIIHYCPSPDTLSYYDNNLDPGTYIYSCSAKYDLSVYGFPGQFGYSIRTDAMDTAVIICGDQIPFFEGWTQNNFTYNDWTFSPSQGNWNTTSMTGNPLPAADFSWSGKEKMKDVNYNNAMVSRIMDGSEWTCSHLYLSFDLKLLDHNGGSTEKMAVEINYDHAWHALGEFANNGSFDWQTVTFPIDSVRGKGFRAGFRAHGENTANILHWYIDNIHIYGICLPPAGLEWTANSQQVNLNWTAPCSNITGYNVFRSDPAGNPPFILVNPTPLTGTSFTDVPPGWSTNVAYQYYVTAIQMNHVIGSQLCESASDTVLVEFPTGIPEPVKEKTSIYPNPSDNYIIIHNDVPLSKVEMMSGYGKVIFTGTYKDEKQIMLNTAGYSQGLYFVRITSATGTLFRKVVICR